MYPLNVKLFQFSQGESSSKYIEVHGLINIYYIQGFSKLGPPPHPLLNDDLPSCFNHGEIARHDEIINKPILERWISKHPKSFHQKISHTIEKSFSEPLNPEFSSQNLHKSEKVEVIIF